MFPGWWIQGAVEYMSKAHPGYSICIVDNEGPLCGLLPNDWNGKRLIRETKEKGP
jgi:hypothetical protein